MRGLGASDEGIVMSTGQSAAVQRQRLRIELRKARDKARHTQRQVIEAMDWSPFKLIRIESGEVGISVNDLHALLRFYGVTDRRRVDELVALAKGSRKQPFSDYKHVLSKDLLKYLALEASASMIRSFEPQLVSGLLQTEEYARAVLKEYAFDLSEEDQERIVQARLERQELLDHDEPPEMFFILDEAVIQRWVGGPGVMRKQLERLKELAVRPRVSVQIMPFTAGGHIGLRGPFALLSFEDPTVDDVLHLENPRGDVTFVDDPEETTPYLEAFWRLEEQAAKKGEVEDMLDAAIDRLAAAGQPGVAQPVDEPEGDP
jgi:transcriptional regulator with XRE-family HTH domain